MANAKEIANGKKINNDNSGEINATWSWYQIHLNCHC